MSSPTVGLTKSTKRRCVVCGGMDFRMGVARTWERNAKSSANAAKTNATSARCDVTSAPLCCLWWDGFPHGSGTHVGAACEAERERGERERDERALRRDERAAVSFVAGWISSWEWARTWKRHTKPSATAANATSARCVVTSAPRSGANTAGDCRLSEERERERADQAAERRRYYSPRARCARSVSAHRAPPRASWRAICSVLSCVDARRVVLFDRFGVP
jgi:hypothetical protein